jgi:hypothetical protein
MIHVLVNYLIEAKNAKQKQAHPGLVSDIN